MYPVSLRFMLVFNLHFPRRNDSGGSAHSAFGPLLPNGTPSQLVPKWVFPSDIISSDLVFKFYGLCIWCCAAYGQCLNANGNAFPSFLQARKPEKRHDLTDRRVHYEEVSHILHQLWQWCPSPKRNPRHCEKPYPQLLQFHSRPQPGNTQPAALQCAWPSRGKVELKIFTSMFPFTVEETISTQPTSAQPRIISLADSRRSLKKIQVRLWWFPASRPYPV